MGRSLLSGFMPSDVSSLLRWNSHPRRRTTQAGKKGKVTQNCFHAEILKEVAVAALLIRLANRRRVAIRGEMERHTVSILRNKKEENQNCSLTAPGSTLICLLACASAAASATVCRTILTGKREENVGGASDYPQSGAQESTSNIRMTRRRWRSLHGNRPAARAGRQLRHTSLGSHGVLRDATGILGAASTGLSAARLGNGSGGVGNELPVGATEGRRKK